MSDVVATRPLTQSERELASWMLTNGTADASAYLSQLSVSEATTWSCVCGCASFHFKVAGKPAAPPGVNILGDFVAGDDGDMFGIFIYQSGGILSGIEVYGLAADAPTVLPTPDGLRPFRVSGDSSSAHSDGGAHDC